MKACPKCQTPAPLAAPYCVNCAHQFRTVFAPPVDRTQAISAPLAFPAYPGPPAPASRGRTTAFWLLTCALPVLLVLGIFIVAGEDAGARSREMDRAGHSVSASDAELIGLNSSQRQVWVTLGRPQYVMQSGSMWVWPTENNGNVGIKFVPNDSGEMIVRAVVVSDQNVNVVYDKE